MNDDDDDIMATTITISTPENKISNSDSREEDVNDIDCLSRKQLLCNAETSISKKWHYSEKQSWNFVSNTLDEPSSPAELLVKKK